MRKIAFSSIAFVLFFTASLSAAAATSTFRIDWQKCLGGSHRETGNLVPADGGGYLVYGTTRSFDGDVADYQGIRDPICRCRGTPVMLQPRDVWILKLDHQGNQVWSHCYGGSGVENFPRLAPTSDGGGILSFGSSSPDGNAGAPLGFQDMSVVKLSASGTVQLAKRFGGRKTECFDWFSQVIEVGSGVFVAACHTESNDLDVSGNHGNFDAWLVCFDLAGNARWQECIGGTSLEQVRGLEKSQPGSFFLVGGSQSGDEDMAGNPAALSPLQENLYSRFGALLNKTPLFAPVTGEGLWIARYDAGGGRPWLKFLTGGVSSFFGDSFATPDGGIVVISLHSRVVRSLSGISFRDSGWAEKFDRDGTSKWKTCLGGKPACLPFRIRAVSSGGFIVCGATQPEGGGSASGAGVGNAWVVKLTSDGAVEWGFSYDGGGLEMANDIVQTPDGGYLFVGESNRPPSSFPPRNTDGWLVRLSSSGTLLEQRLFGGSGYDHFSSIQAAPDGGFIISGETSSNDGDVSGNHGETDIWILKLAP